MTNFLEFLECSRIVLCLQIKDILESVFEALPKFIQYYTSIFSKHGTASLLDRQRLLAPAGDI